MATSTPSGGDPAACVYVLGHTVKGDAQESRHGQLGACPFSMRVLMALEEKQIPYDIDYIKPRNKPMWLLAVNPAGTLPILKDLMGDKFVSGSDSIIDYLEDKFPSKLLGKVKDVPQPGANLAARFKEFYRSDDPGARAALESELRQVEAAVPNEHPYCGGKDVNSWDLVTAPHLHLNRVGCAHLKAWDFGEEYPNIKAYLHRMTGRRSWRNVASWDEESILEDLKEVLEVLEGK